MNRNNRLIYLLLVASGTAFSLAIPIVVLLFVGLYIDQKYHTAPLFLILGILIGFIGGVVNTFKLLKFLRVL